MSQILDSAPISAPISASKSSWKKHLGNWKLYAAAGGASVAAGTSADAGIVYSGSLNVKAQVAVAGGSNIANFSIAGNQLKAMVSNKSAINSGVTYRWGGGFIKFPQAGSIKGMVSSSANGGLALFAQGGPISAKASSYLSKGPLVLRQVTSSGSLYGVFPLNQTAFAGFDLNGKLGWIKVKLGDAGSTGIPTSVTILGWAYNDVAGATILAGQTTSAVPEPGTMALGLLASGAGGLVALRRAKKKAQAEAAV